MIIPCGLPRHGSRQQRPVLAIILALGCAAIFLLERSLLLWPEPVALRLGGAIGGLRLHADPALHAWWQAWTGALMIHDWFHAVLSLPIWLLWTPALERRLGSGGLALLLLAGLPMGSLLGLHPLPVQAVLSNGTALALLVGAGLGLWHGQHMTVLILRPGLQVLAVRRLSTRLRWPSLVLLSGEGIRLFLEDQALLWPHPVVILSQFIATCALGLLLAQILDRRQTLGVSP